MRQWIAGLTIILPRDDAFQITSALLIGVVYKSIEKKKRRHKPIAANLRLKRSGSRRTEQMQIPPRAKIEVNDDAMQIIPFLLIGT